MVQELLWMKTAVLLSGSRLCLLRRSLCGYSQAEREAGRCGNGTGSDGNPGMLLRVHLGSCPQALDLVRLC